MALSEEDKVFIKVLCQETWRKGHRAIYFIKEFMNKNCSLSSVKKLLPKT